MDSILLEIMKLDKTTRIELIKELKKQIYECCDECKKHKKYIRFCDSCKEKKCNNCSKYWTINFNHKGTRCRSCKRDLDLEEDMRIRSSYQ